VTEAEAKTEPLNVLVNEAVVLKEAVTVALAVPLNEAV
jgi:hypothetical protein